MRISIASCLFIFVVVVIVQRFTARGKRPRMNEPPIMHNNIPFVGHILGIVRKKENYYTYLR